MATVRPVRIEGSDSESDEYEPVDAAEGSRGERLLQELGDQDGAVKQELRPRPKKSNGELNPFCLGVNRNNVYRCGRRRQTAFCNHHATQWEALDDEYQHVLNEAIKLRPFDEAFWDRQHETVRNLWMQTVAGNNAQLDALTEQVAVKAEEQAVQYLTQAAEGAEKELEDAEERRKQIYSETNAQRLQRFAGRSSSSPMGRRQPAEADRFDQLEKELKLVKAALKAMAGVLVKLQRGEDQGQQIDQFLAQVAALEL